MAVDSLSVRNYFGTTGGEVYASADDGDSWTAVAEHFQRYCRSKRRALA